MGDDDPQGLANLDPRLAGIIKGLTKHCFTQNIKALSLMVSEKKIFFTFFPIISLCRPMTPWGIANLDPRGHDWQDL